VRSAPFVTRPRPRVGPRKGLERELTPNPVTQTDVDLDTSAPTFIVSDGPDAVVVSGPIARLAEGEALFRAGGEPTQLRSESAAGGDGAGYSIVADAGDPALTFTAGPAPATSTTYATCSSPTTHWSCTPTSRRSSS
jgi:hypothetical protein